MEVAAEGLYDIFGFEIGVGADTTQAERHCFPMAPEERAPALVVVTQQPLF